MVNAGFPVCRSLYGQGQGNIWRGLGASRTPAGERVRREFSTHKRSLTQSTHTLYHLYNFILIRRNPPFIHLKPRRKRPRSICGVGRLRGRVLSCLLRCWSRICGILRAKYRPFPVGQPPELPHAVCLLTTACTQRSWQASGDVGPGGDCT